jgi:hypothetical protein
MKWVFSLDVRTLQSSLSFLEVKIPTKTKQNKTNKQTDRQTLPKLTPLFNAVTTLIGQGV